MTTYFSNNQFVVFALGLLAFLFSGFFLWKENMKFSVFFLFVTAFLFRFFMISLDPYLHDWDEQFHALVAKNLSHHPFKPTLYDNPILEYDYKNWGLNHVWVHKQPLYLWQMALSIKLFGTNEIAVRLPSAILSSLLVLVVFRIGKLIFSEKVGWLAAFMLTFSYFQNSVVTGFAATDHNDIAFFFYLSCSMWAYFEYLNNPSKKWIILIGLFCGCAVLVKWLFGLLVLPVWGIHVLTSDKRKKLKSYLDIAFAFGVALIVFVPWQFYILKAFPIESKYEFAFTAKHLTEALEGHVGDNWYHLDKIPFLYGKWAVFFILPGVYLLFAKSAKMYRSSLVLFVLIVYVFYSFVPTKMQMFTLCIALLIYLGFANVFLFVLEQLKTVIKNAMLFKSISAFILIVFAFLYIDIEEIQLYHTQWKKEHFRTSFINNAEISKSLNAKLGDPKRTIVFNAASLNAIQVMFYSKYTAYGRYPYPEEYKKLKAEGYSFAIFYDEKFPDYIIKDVSLTILPNKPVNLYE